MLSAGVGFNCIRVPKSLGCWCSFSATRWYSDTYPGAHHPAGSVRGQKNYILIQNKVRLPGDTGSHCLTPWGLRSPTGACDTNRESRQPQIPESFQETFVQNCETCGGSFTGLAYRVPLRRDNLLTLGVGSTSVGPPFA